LNLLSAAGKREHATSAHRAWPFTARRIVFPLAAVFTALLGLDVALFDWPALAADLPLLFGADLILFGAAYVLLLSARLAGVAAVCLLLAFTWSAGVLAICAIAIGPALLAALIAVEAAGAILILQLLYAAIGDVCRGQTVASAVHASAGRMVAPVTCALLSVLASLVVLDGTGLSSVLAAGAAASVAMGVAIFSVAPPFASRVVFDEARISRANRARELAEGLLARAAVVAKPRWALAGLGIAAVLFAVMVFGGNMSTPILASPMVVLWREAGPALGFAFLVTGFIGVWLLRDWRALFLIAIPAYLAATAAALLASALALAPANELPALLVLGGAFGSVACAIAAERFAAHRRFDDAPDIALQRSLNDCAMPVLTAAAALALGALLLATAHPLGLAAALTMIVEAVLALVLMAIFAAVVADLFPRRRSFEDMYGARSR